MSVDPTRAAANAGPILIRFSRGTGWKAAVVRWATWSPFAHVGFRLSNGYVLDATPEFGVSIRCATDDAGTRYFLPTAPQAAVRQAVQWGVTQIGMPYDWTAIYGMAWREDWHKPGKWFCSEFVEQAMYTAGAELLNFGNQVDRITPRDLALSPLLRPYDLTAQEAAHAG